MNLRYLASGPVAVLALGIAVIGWACASDDDSGPVSNEAIRPTVTASSASTLVGEWHATHDCAVILDLFEQAGMRDAALQHIVENQLIPGASAVKDIGDPADPCANAVQHDHAHL